MCNNNLLVAYKRKLNKNWITIWNRQQNAVKAKEIERQVTHFQRRFGKINEVHHLTFSFPNEDYPTLEFRVSASSHILISKWRLSNPGIQYKCTISHSYFQMRITQHWNLGHAYHLTFLFPNEDYPTPEFRTSVPSYILISKWRLPNTGIQGKCNISLLY